MVDSLGVDVGAHSLLPEQDTRRHETIHGLASCHSTHVVAFGKDHLGGDLVSGAQFALNYQPLDSLFYLDVERDGRTTIQHVSRTKRLR